MYLYYVWNKWHSKIKSTRRQMQNVFPTQKANFLHFNGVTKWLASDGESISELTWIRMAVTITLKRCFSQSHVFFETRQKREKREKAGRKKQLPFLKSRVTLCWWTCSAHQDEKEVPQLWNPPVKINILFKLLSEKGRGKMRVRERWKGRERRGKRKRHRWGRGALG